jgi:hypothetical protein
MARIYGGSLGFDLLRAILNTTPRENGSHSQ